MRTHFTRSLAVTIATLLVAAACAGGGPTGQGQQPDSGTLTVGIGGYPTSLHPNQMRSAPGFSMYRAMYDTLTVADSTKGGELQPSLATSWKLLNDTTWQFKLRDGVKWTDGTPFSADDVVATLELTLKAQPPHQYVFRIADVTRSEAVDKLTVNIVTKAKNVLLPVGLSDIYIYQAKQIKDGGNDAINKDPRTTGPFKLSGREEGVSATLVRNPDHWGPKAKFEKLVFRAFPEDATRVSALERGEVDIAFNVPPDDAARLRTKGLEVPWTPLGQTMMVNVRSDSPASPYSNKKVRQALNYAVDKDTLIKNVMVGFGEKLRGQIVGPDGVGYNDKISAYPYEPQTAKRLLAEAGVASGFPMTIVTSEGRYAKSKEVSEAIAGQLRDVGVNVKVEVMEHGTLVSRIATIESYYFGWNYFPVMDADFVVQHFICAGRFKLMCNKDYDALMARQREESDPQKRAELLKQMQTIIRDEAPAIFLFQAPDVFGVSKRVKGFKPTPDNVVHFELITVGQ